MFTNLNTIKPQLELTLAIFKPDLCRYPISFMAVKRIILQNNFYFVRSAKTKMTYQDAERFYSIHKDKFFYQRLVTFMSSNPISVHILARDNAISYWRKLMGPTKVYIARHEQPESIRGKYGLTDTRNATHGSDSKESAIKEISFFFPNFNIDQWFQNEEYYFRNGIIKFNSKSWEHKVRLKSENNTN